MFSVSNGTSTVSINRLVSQSSTRARGIFGLQIAQSRGVSFSDKYDQEYEIGTIEIQNVSFDDAFDLRNFVVSTIHFSGEFSMTSDKSDLGNGVGVTVTNCFLNEVNETSQIVTKSGTFNKYNVSIPYIRVL